jgi:hypothetical protein
MVQREKIQSSDQKSHSIWITRRRGEIKFIDIYLNNNTLEQLDKLKYLGINTDSKFKFIDHTKYAIDRCPKLINALFKSARIS